MSQKTKFQIWLAITSFEIIILSLLAVVPINYGVETELKYTIDNATGFHLIQNINALGYYFTAPFVFINIVWLYLTAYIIYDAISPARTT